MDDVSTGEIVRRLDRFEGRLDGFEALLRDRTVSQPEMDRRFTEVDRDLQQEVADRKAGDQELKERHDRTGTNWRQAIYAGLIPGVLYLLTILFQLKSGGP